MQRVAFLIDSGERIDCLLNPETVQVTRLAGVRQRGGADGQLTGVGLADDPLLFTGGGRTELVLDLLFDIDFAEGQVAPPTCGRSPDHSGCWPRTRRWNTAGCGPRWCGWSGARPGTCPV